MGTMHTDKAWKIYGINEPYFGVMGQDLYLKKNLDTTTMNLTEIYSCFTLHWKYMGVRLIFRKNQTW
jgi:hypothetical protein